MQTPAADLKEIRTVVHELLCGDAPSSEYAEPSVSRSKVSPRPASIKIHELGALTASPYTAGSPATGIDSATCALHSLADMVGMRGRLSTVLLSSRFLRTHCTDAPNNLLSGCTCIGTSTDAEKSDSSSWNSKEDQSTDTFSLTFAG